MSGEVFLGGSCGETTWRREIAIPMLREARVTYFDPQLPAGAWTSDREPAEMAAKAAALSLVFVVSGRTCGVAAVAEASYLIAARRPLALVVEDVVAGTMIDGRRSDARLADDLNRGRLFLRSMAREHGVTVHESVACAVQEAIRWVGEARGFLTFADLERIIAETSFGSRTFRVSSMGDGFLVWLEGNVRDARDGSSMSARGRAWFIHRADSQAQVVQTLFKAALTWEEHEAREHFRFRGVPVFHPHVPLEQRLASPTLAPEDRSG